MVRYFPNKFEEYTDGAEFLNKENIISVINQHLQLITKRFPPNHNNVGGGLYVGVTGIAYMYYHLAKNPLLSEYKNQFMQSAFEYLKPALETSAGDKTSFLLGDAGTCAIATALNKEAGNEKFLTTLDMYKSLASIYLNPKFIKCGADELFVGRSGYLAGGLWLSREINMQVIGPEDLFKICDVIVSCGREYSKRNNSRCPLMYHYYSTEYLGAAHGVSFIMQMLLTVPGYLEFNKFAAQEIKATIQYIASLQNNEGNWPCCMEETVLTEHKLVHWCHGAPGMIYLMAKAFLVFKEPIYRTACLKAGEVIWNKGLLRKGPGLCHGISGNAYAFLLLYRLTMNKKYIYRAKMFAEFMNSEEFLREARVPDNPESLYEGLAGTVCFLSDLLVPEKAEFPFQDVFTM